MQKKLPKSNLTTASKRNLMVSVLVALAVAIVGYTIFVTNASGLTASFEAEKSQPREPAVAVNDSNASGGRALRFGPQAQPPQDDRQGFVYREGRNLMLDGEVWTFAGVNNYALTGCHYSNLMTEQQTDAFFANLQPNSLTRVWAFQEQGETGIARTVAAAERHNQKILFALADGAEYCGSPDFDAGWYEGGYKGRYFDWVENLTQKYKDSEAVAIWEIMNEPGHSVDGVSNDEMKRFFDAAAAHIKANDPNHLVSTGTLAPYAFDGFSEYKRLHSGPNIDLLSLHEYDYPYQSSRTIVSPHFDDAKRAADELNKPVFIGEAGISLANGCMSAQERASALKQKYDQYLERGAAGVLYWVVLSEPNNSGDVCDSKYGTRDPLSGAVMDMVNNYQKP